MRGVTRAFTIGLFALATLAGCENQKTYSYFTIPVRFDDQTVQQMLLDQVASCGISVEQASGAIDFADLGCSKGSVRYDVGLADWSTTLGSGQIRFSVHAYDFNSRELARGVSDYWDITPNKTTTLPTLLMEPYAAGIQDAAPALEDSGAPDAGGDAANDGPTHD